MAQVKKEAVRDAIFESAFTLFKERGYSETSMAQIAKQARISPANIYVYFGSKLDLLYQIYSPWLLDRMERLDREVGAVAGCEPRLRLILTTIWKDIPAEENGFANNIMQAVSMARPEEGYKRDLLTQVEHKVSRMLRDALPPERAAAISEENLARIVFMAFDGFALNYKMGGQGVEIDGLIDAMIELLLGSGRQAAANDTA